MKKSKKPIQLNNYPKNEQLTLLAATGLGSGLLTPAPGTWGTIPGVILAYFLIPYPVLHLWVLILLILLGTYLCERAGQILQTHDHSSIVIDEIAGVLIVFFSVNTNGWTLLLGFLLFRFFDILKPYPIALIDKKLKNGFGVMADDLLAGVYAGVVLQVILIFL